MTIVISGIGTKILLQASKTLLIPVTFTRFSDDSDAYDVPSVDVSDAASGSNGDLITWSTAVPLTVILSIIATSDDDQILQLLLEANRAAAGKSPAGDIIQMVHQYPEGNQTTYTNGIIKSGPPSRSMTSAGRYKTNIYGFIFENKVSS